MKNATRGKKKLLKLKLQTKNSSSPIVTEKISSYFPKLTQESNSQTETVHEVNFEDRIKEKPVPIFSPKKIDINTLDDSVFVTKEKPKILKSFMDINKTQKHKSKKVNKNNHSNEFTENCDGDVNLDHLQLALAMSNSLQDNTGQNSEESLPNTQQKLLSLKETLKQFGFNSGDTPLRISGAKVPPQKRRKKRLFKTTLLVRTEEDRKKIIEDKVSQILSNIALYNKHISKYSTVIQNLNEKPSSFLLREIYSTKAPNYKKNSLNFPSNDYYTTLIDLNNSAKAGSLLRNWHLIPGREKTPPREISHSKNMMTSSNSNEVQTLKYLSNNQLIPLESSDIKDDNWDITIKINKLEFSESSEEFYTSNEKTRGQSPDLFSDDESSSLSNNKKYSLSPNIIHYESFNDGSNFNLKYSSDEESPLKKKQNCVDLTQESPREICINKNMINEIENDDTSLTQLLTLNDTKQTQKDEHKNNDSIIEGLMHKVINNSQKSFSQKNFYIADENLDLIYDAALLSPKVSNSSNPHCMNLTDVHNNPIENSIHCISSDSEDIIFKPTIESNLNQKDYFEKSDCVFSDEEHIILSPDLSLLNVSKVIMPRRSTNKNNITVISDSDNDNESIDDEVKSLNDSLFSDKNESYVKDKLVCEENICENINLNLFSMVEINKKSDVSLISSNSNIKQNFNDTTNKNNSNIESESDDILKLNLLPVKVTKRHSISISSSDSDIENDNLKLLNKSNSDNKHKNKRKLSTKCTSRHRNITLSPNGSDIETDKGNSSYESNIKDEKKNKKFSNTRSNSMSSSDSEIEQNNVDSFNIAKKKNKRISRPKSNLQKRSILISSEDSDDSNKTDYLNETNTDTNKNNNHSHTSSIVSDSDSDHYIKKSNEKKDNCDSINEDIHKDNNANSFNSNDSIEKFKLYEQSGSSIEDNSLVKLDVSSESYKMKQKELSQNLNIRDEHNILLEDKDVKSFDRTILHESTGECSKNYNSKKNKLTRKRSLSVLSNGSDEENSFALSQSSANSLMKDDELNYSSYRSTFKKYDSSSSEYDSDSESENDTNKKQSSDKNNAAQSGLNKSKLTFNDKLQTNEELNLFAMNMADENYDILNDKNKNNSPEMQHNEEYIYENDDLDHIANHLAQENLYHHYSKENTEMSNITLKHRRISELKSTPLKVNMVSEDVLKIGDMSVCEVNNLDKTPDGKNGSPGPEMIIKTTNITPIGNYNEMDTPKRNKELDKYGLKPMSKGKSVKILEYLYNATHPICNENQMQSEVTNEEKENEPAPKRRKLKEKYISNREVRNGKNNQTSIKKNTQEVISLNFALNDLKENEMIFERTFSKKILSCALPFHIAWHNFISCQPELLDAILLYEPIQLEEIYLYFKNLGFKYHIHDITRFLDKKCITIRTGQNN